LTYPDSYNGKHAYADQKKQRWKHPEMKFKDSKMKYLASQKLLFSVQLARKKRLPSLAGSILFFESKRKAYGRPRKYRTIFERHLPEAIGLIKPRLHVRVPDIQSLCTCHLCFLFVSSRCFFFGNINPVKLSRG